jgi:valyl-tRNA synthetase
MNLDPDKINAYKKFANKLWNVSRFILSNLDDADLSTQPTLTAQDRKILEELNTVAQDVTNQIEAYRLYIAAEKLYHYVWHTVADVVIEGCKARLQSEDLADKNAAQWTLYTVLTTSLKMLHPFMPFVTEEIWKDLPEKDAELLMVANWPMVNK